MQRKTVSLGRTASAIMHQMADYSEWSDEELVAGRRKSRRGTWEGAAPKVVPAELVRELARRQTGRGFTALWAKVEAACEYIAAVSAGDEEGSDVRLRHCQVLLNRVWGMAPQHIDITASEPSIWEKQGVTKAIVVRDAIDVDSDEWVNPFEDENARRLHTLPAATDDEEDNPFADTPKTTNPTWETE